MKATPFRRIGLLAYVVLAIGGAGSVLAGRQLPTIDDHTCEFTSTVSEVAFGLYSGAMKQSTIPISYRCGKSTNNIRLYLSTATPRRMPGPAGNYLAYELYRQDSVGGPLVVWGNTPGTEYIDKHDRKEVVETADIIGQVAAGQNVAAGSYRDPLNVRMTWEKPLKEVTTQAYVTANLLPACTITASDVNFGNYDPLGVNRSGAGSDLDASGTITVTCSAGASPVIWISPGTGARLLSGRGSLTYDLFRDPARTTAWGATQTNGVTLPVSSGTAQSVTVYGRIPRGQNVPAGLYAQSLTVTVNF